MSDDQLTKIERGDVGHPLQTIARLTAEVRRLREAIIENTGVPCRGATYFPEWVNETLK